MFNGELYLIKCLILLEEEAIKIVKYFHNKLSHMGINMLRYEIERRGLYRNKLNDIICNVVKNCETCLVHKLNKFIKSQNIQILSTKPLEIVQAHITYFNKKIELNELHEKYLLNFKDHFSKYAKLYLINDKKSETVLLK